jgi:hypothetical protein
MNASTLQGLVLSVAWGGLACSRVTPTDPASHPAPASSTRAEAASAPPQPSASADAADDPLDASPQEDAAPWQATRVQANGLYLGDFAVAAPAGPDHPRGIVSALGWSNDDAPDVYAVAIDVATAREFERLRIGPSYDAGGAEIHSTSSGVVVALQGKTTFDLTWVEAGHILGAHRSLPGLGVDSHYDFRGFAAYGDRLVLADGGGDGVRLRILDDEGRLVSSHRCHGGLFRPGPAKLERVGDQIVLTNMMIEENKKPVCSLSLHGGGTWHETRLPPGDVVVRRGALYFVREDGETARALGPDLRPTGKVMPLPAETESSECSGLTGTSAWDEATVGGFPVVQMVSCCGDPSPGGLFVCRPRE